MCRHEHSTCSTDSSGASGCIGRIRGNLFSLVRGTFLNYSREFEFSFSVAVTSITTKYFIFSNGNCPRLSPNGEYMERLFIYSLVKSDSLERKRLGNG